MDSEINISRKFCWSIFYTFIINCTNFKKKLGFPINIQGKIMFKIKTKLSFSLWPVRISVLTTCVILSCTGQFLIRARDCDV